MLRVEQEVVLEDVEARWVDVSALLDNGASARALALVVTMPGADLWVCCSLAPMPADEVAMRECVMEMESETGAAAVGRCSAAFGMPWARLTEVTMRGQLVLLMGEDMPWMEQVRESTPEQLLLLRERLYPGKPADVVRALGWCRQYAGSVQ